jgi:outer membrane protein TolC
MAKSRGEHLPTLNLVGSYQINSEDFSEFADNYTVGAVARINLFSGHRISSKTKEAMAFLRQVRSTIKAMELGVRVETQKAFLQTQSAWKQIQVAQTAVAHAEEALRIVRNRYKSGLLTIVSLLDAEVALQQARTRHFRSMHDYKVARINLALAAGTIDTDFQ